MGFDPLGRRQYRSCHVRGFVGDISKARSRRLTFQGLSTCGVVARCCGPRGSRFALVHWPGGCKRFSVEFGAMVAVRFGDFDHDSISRGDGVSLRHKSADGAACGLGLGYLVWGCYI